MYSGVFVPKVDLLFSLDADFREIWQKQVAFKLQERSGDSLLKLLKGQKFQGNSKKNSC